MLNKRYFSPMTTDAKNRYYNPIAILKKTPNGPPDGPYYSPYYITLLQNQLQNDQTPHQQTQGRLPRETKNVGYYAQPTEMNRMRTPTTQNNIPNEPRTINRRRTSAQGTTCRMKRQPPWRTPRNHDINDAKSTDTSSNECTGRFQKSEHAWDKNETKKKFSCTRIRSFFGIKYSDFSRRP